MMMNQVKKLLTLLFIVYAGSDLLAQHTIDKSKLTGTWLLKFEGKDSLSLHAADCGYTTIIVFSEKDTFKKKTEGLFISAHFEIEKNTIKLTDVSENGLKYKVARWLTVSHLSDSTLIIKPSLELNNYYEFYERANP